MNFSVTLTLTQAELNRLLPTIRDKIAAISPAPGNSCNAAQPHYTQAELARMNMTTSVAAMMATRG